MIARNAGEKDCNTAGLLRDRSSWLDVQFDFSGFAVDFVPDEVVIMERRQHAPKLAYGSAYANIELPAENTTYCFPFAW